MIALNDKANNILSTDLIYLRKVQSRLHGYDCDCIFMAIIIVYPDVRTTYRSEQSDSLFLGQIENVFPPEYASNFLSK